MSPSRLVSAEMSSGRLLATVTRTVESFVASGILYSPGEIETRSEVDRGFDSSLIRLKGSVGSANDQYG